MDLPKGVTCVKSKGNDYWYYRPNRKAAQLKKEKLISIKLPGTPYRKEFWDTVYEHDIISSHEYYRKLNLIGEIDDQELSHYLKKSGYQQHLFKVGTFAALIHDYQSDIAFKMLAERTQKDYEEAHEIFKSMWADIKVSRIKPKHVLALRNKFSDTPYKANRLIRTLSALLKWGIPMEYIDTNPCYGIKMLPTDGEYEAWTWEQIHFFKAHASPHIWNVLAMSLYTGQRISDVLKMKWSDVHNGMISVKQQKSKKPLFIPIHPELETIIKDLPKNSIYILLNSKGKPWKSGWQSALQKQRKKEVMKPLEGERLVTHGLRKSACCFLAEAGCTDSEIQAITGHSKAMVEYYRRQVNQVKLAKKAIIKFSKCHNAKK